MSPAERNSSPTDRASSGATWATSRADRVSSPTARASSRWRCRTSPAERDSSPTDRASSGSRSATSRADRVSSPTDRPSSRWTYRHISPGTRAHRRPIDLRPLRDGTYPLRNEPHRRPIELRPVGDVGISLAERASSRTGRSSSGRRCRHVSCSTRRIPTDRTSTRVGRAKPPPDRASLRARPAKSLAERSPLRARRAKPLTKRGSLRPKRTNISPPQALSSAGRCSGRSGLMGRHHEPP